MNRNRHALMRVAAAIGCLAPGLVVGSAGEVVAATTPVPPTAVYAIGGPATPLPITHTTTAAATSVLVSAEGFVASVDCPAAFETGVVGGIGVITAMGGGSIPAATDLACTVSLGLADGAPPSVLVTLSERDAFNDEVGAASQLVALEPIDVTASVGPVSLTGGTYHPAEPRSIGDELTRTITFTLTGPRAMSFSVPAGTAMTGCAASTASTATCTLTRTLSVGDLASGSARLAPTLLVDGFPVSLPPGDADTPSERRLVVDAIASSPIVRAGETVSVDATVTNIGSIELTGLALSGAGITAADCGGEVPAAVVLAPGTSVTCSATHVATPGDVGGVSPVVARATAPFGADSDLVDDDATSSTDIDAVSLGAPYAVVDADVAAAVSLGSAVAFVDDAGTDRLAATLTLSSAGALSGASVVLPVHPETGITVDGCDSVVGDDCLVTLGDIAGGTPISRPLEVVLDAAAFPTGGVDGAEVTGQLSADGDITVDLTPGIVRTAGLAASVVPAVVDASGSTATFAVEVTPAAGQPVGVVFPAAVTRAVEPVECRHPDGALAPLAQSGTGRSLGLLPGGATVRCTFRQQVAAADRTTGSMPVEVLVTASAGGEQLRRDAVAELETTALVAVPGPAPAAPEHGYSVAGTPERPASLTYPFELVAYGRLGARGTASVTPTFAGGDAVRCDAGTGDPVRIACSATHAITAADLASGRYDAMIEASADGLVASATLTIPTPTESLDLLVTEISTPKQAVGYRVGESVRLLVQLRNRGSLPLTLGAMTVNAPPASRAARADRPDAVDGCSGGAAIDPGELLDCDLDVVISSGNSNGRLAILVTTQQGVSVGFTVDVAIEPRAPAVPPQPTTPSTRLPATGADPSILVVTALLLCGVGLALRVVGRRGTRCAPPC